MEIELKMAENDSAKDEYFKHQSQNTHDEKEQIFNVREGLLKQISLYISAILIFFALVAYLANVVFGDRSVMVLIDLQNEKIALIGEVRELKNQNAKLQKEYLERAVLDPDINK